MKKWLKNNNENVDRVNDINPKEISIFKFTLIIIVIKIMDIAVFKNIFS